MRQHPDTPLHYHNLVHSIWNEWGILQLTLHRELYAIDHEKQLAQATRPGHAIIVQNAEDRDALVKLRPATVTAWPRWLTKGKAPDGSSRFSLAWKNRDLSLVERQFYIVYFLPETTK
jgi:hypothetical protein